MYVFSGVRFSNDRDKEMQKIEIEAEHLKHMTQIYIDALTSLFMEANEKNETINLVPSYTCNDTMLFWREGRRLYE